MSGKPGLSPASPDQRVNSGSPKRGRPLGSAAEKTRARLLDAAEEHFDAQSFADVSLNKIAKTAGLTGPAIYNHFESKDHLFLEVVKRRILNYNVAITQAVAAPGTWQVRYNRLLEAVTPLQGPSAGFQTIGSAVINRLRQNPEKFDEIRELREVSSVVFRGLIKQAIEAGDLPEKTDPTITGDLLMAITSGAINTVSFYHPEPDKMSAIIGSLKSLLSTDS